MHLSRNLFWSDTTVPTMHLFNVSKLVSLKSYSKRVSSKTVLNKGRITPGSQAHHKGYLVEDHCRDTFRIGTTCSYANSWSQFYSFWTNRKTSCMRHAEQSAGKKPGNLYRPDLRSGRVCRPHCHRWGRSEAPDDVLVVDHLQT